MEMLIIGVLGGLAIAAMFFFASSKKERIERIEKDVEELKKKGTVEEARYSATRSEIDSINRTVSGLENTFKAHEDRIGTIIASALAPVMVEIKHLNQAVEDLKK